MCFYSVLFTECEVEIDLWEDAGPATEGSLKYIEECQLSLEEA